MKFMLRIIALLVGLGLVQGCYTQLKLAGQSNPSARRSGTIAEKDTSATDTFHVLIDTIVEEGDTTFDTTWYATLQQVPAEEKQERRLRTVIITERYPRYCFWTQDFFGYPELECFDTYADYRWYLNVHAPWWIRDRVYSYRDHCPPHYYYDPYTGYCRYYRDYDHYYRYPRYDKSSPSEDRGARRAPRSRSYKTGDTPDRAPHDESAREPSPSTRKQPPRERRRRGREYGVEREESPPPPAKKQSEPQSRQPQNDDDDSDDKDTDKKQPRRRKDPRRY
ncbi:MAG: hypothetical protein GF398_10915 [Chitinivibrionales bacterium]|nr:hypothetical protein [Chitinivibrionales bacterium]